jgi:hypothetical protein
MPPRSYAAGRGWDPAHLDAAERRLEDRGLLSGGRPTHAGMAAREALETETDRLCHAMVDALGDDLVELVGRLQGWAASIRAADGYYPSSPQEAILATGVPDWMRARAGALQRGGVVTIDQSGSAPDDSAVLSAAARRLRNVLEPIASNVYFSPDVNDAFEELGFGPGVAAEGCLTIAEPSGYYCSRAACMGQVPGEVVVAAFGVFNPRLIIPAVERGWSIAGADAVLEARERGATASLTRILGDQPQLPVVTAVLQRAAAAGTASGRFLYAGLRSLGVPRTPWGALWRAVDTIREHRGDSHLAAWISSGLDPVEIGLLTEIYYGMPTKRYHRGRGWTEADLDSGLDRLRDRGLVDGEPPHLTAEGAGLRESIELATDIQQRMIIRAIGEDLDDLIDTLGPWSAAIVRAGGFPSSVEQIPPTWGRLDQSSAGSSPS